MDKPSVAVLPFSNMSADPDQEFFSDGITEDIITDLAKVSGLFILGRNTVFTYKGKSINLERTAKELGVRYLVEGSVRKAGNRVRVNAQLIEGASGGHLWADRYDRDLSDIFAVQDEVTKTIVEQLKVRLLPDERRAIEEAPTNNVEAYTCYLKGRQFLRMGTKSALTIGRRMFARAIELDQSYARAYVGIANCESRLYSLHNTAVSTDSILATAERALAIEPDLPEAHAARGYALMIAGHHEEAALSFEHALALNPNSFDSNQQFARFCVTTGDFERAAKLYLRALELKPDDYQSPIFLMSVLRSLGREKEAKKYARLGVKRAEDVLRTNPDDSRPVQQGAVALAALGEYDRAKEWLARALEIDPEDNQARYNAACTYSQLGEADQAIALLETLWPNASHDFQSLGNLVREIRRDLPGQARPRSIYDRLEER
jgi:adenylate cyclase